jgi:hypothetical protein
MGKKSRAKEQEVSPVNHMDMADETQYVSGCRLTLQAYAACCLELLVQMAHRRLQIAIPSPLS